MNQGTNKQAVILLHGLGGTALNMKRMEWALKREGYLVTNLSYRSQRIHLEDLADFWLEGRIGDLDSPHFVTHSMGGLILRRFRQTFPGFQTGRVVMLGPPNQGSEVADTFAARAILRPILGRNGKRLGTAPGSFPMSLPQWESSSELGIIAGNRSISLYSSRHLPGPNDGKVAVARTALKGSKEQLILPVPHAWLPSHPKVIKAVTSFLESGVFGKSDSVDR